MRISSCLVLLLAMACVAGPGYAADGPTVAPIDNGQLSAPVADLIDPPQGNLAAAGEDLTHEQATLIAQRYFLIHVGCGAFSGLTELTDAWQVNGGFGYTGAPIKGFLINKKTGALTLPEFWVQ